MDKADLELIAISCLSIQPDKFRGKAHSQLHSLHTTRKEAKPKRTQTNNNNKKIPTMNITKACDIHYLLVGL